MSEYLRFFVKSLLFFTALIVAVYAAITLHYFPPAPADWAKLASDAKEASQKFESAASSAATAAQRLAQTATALIQPVNQSLEIARILANQLARGPGLPGGGRGGSSFPFTDPRLGMGGGTLTPAISADGGVQPIQQLERAEPLGRSGILPGR